VETAQIGGSASDEVVRGLITVGEETILHGENAGVDKDVEQHAEFGGIDAERGGEFVAGDWPCGRRVVRMESRLRVNASLFVACVEAMTAVLGDADRVAPVQSYCAGLLLPGDRKSAEPMAARVQPGRVRAAHQSLHHFDRLDELMALVRTALAPKGMLYIDEYIGPSRDEWSWAKLLKPNLVYRLLPRGTRRAKIVRAPINDDDPTEAIRSSQIVRAIERHFAVSQRRNYGGHLLALLYPNMNRTAPRFAEAVAQLVAALATQIGLPFVDLSDYPVDSNAVILVSDTVCRRHSAMPIAFDTSR